MEKETNYEAKEEESLDLLFEVEGVEDQFGPRQDVGH